MAHKLFGNLRADLALHQRAGKFVAQLVGGAQIHTGVVQAGGIAVPLQYNYDKPENP